MAWEGCSLKVNVFFLYPCNIHPKSSSGTYSTPTTLSKYASGVASPGILSTFAQWDPKSPDCVVDDDENDVNVEEGENDVTVFALC